MTLYGREFLFNFPLVTLKALTFENRLNGFLVKQESLLHTDVKRKTTKRTIGLRISGVRRNYVAWLVFVSIHKGMKEDHDVIYADDQMTFRGSYQQQAAFISTHAD